MEHETRIEHEQDGEPDARKPAWAREVVAREN
jgi:hypothetical protein